MQASSRGFVARRKTNRLKQDPTVAERAAAVSDPSLAEAAAPPRLSALYAQHD
jgi:hypothetical protein